MINYNCWCILAGTDACKTCNNNGSVGIIEENDNYTKMILHHDGKDVIIEGGIGFNYYEQKFKELHKLVDKLLWNIQGFDKEDDIDDYLVEIREFMIDNEVT